MPQSVPVSKIMTLPSSWPQIRGDADVCTTIKLLRIPTEETKVEAGHCPLILDENYNLLGFVHLVDLLKNVQRMWEKGGEGSLDACLSNNKVKDLVVEFAGSVTPTDSILVALDIMMKNSVSMVPVKENGKLVGMVKLSDIFNKVAALLFDHADPEERQQWLRDYNV